MALVKAHHDFWDGASSTHEYKAKGNSSIKCFTQTSSLSYCKLKLLTVQASLKPQPFFKALFHHLVAPSLECSTVYSHVLLVSIPYMSSWIFADSHALQIVNIPSNPSLVSADRQGVEDARERVAVMRRVNGALRRPSFIPRLGLRSHGIDREVTPVRTLWHHHLHGCQCGWGFLARLSWSPQTYMDLKGYGWYSSWAGSMRIRTDKLRFGGLCPYIGFVDLDLLYLPWAQVMFVYSVAYQQLVIDNVRMAPCVYDSELRLHWPLFYSTSWFHAIEGCPL